MHIKGSAPVARPARQVVGSSSAGYSCGQHFLVSSMFRGFFLLVFLALIAGVVALPFLLVADQPTISKNINLTATEIDQAKALLKRNDPRRLEAGELVTQWIDEEEAELIVGYLLAIGGDDTVTEVHFAPCG